MKKLEIEATRPSGIEDTIKWIKNWAKLKLTMVSTMTLDIEQVEIKLAQLAMKKLCACDWTDGIKSETCLLDQQVLSETDTTVKIGPIWSN